MDNAAKSAALEALLSTANEAELAAMYDKYMPSAFSESTYSANCKALGIMDKDIPSGVRLYSATFENKDQVAELIKRYNKSVDEDSQITYTDYVAAMMSSISTIINVISYVLIAFVSISLVVSSIMIGIITYISVLERTKEIGILRSIRASKRDICHHAAQHSHKPYNRAFFRYFRRVGTTACGSGCARPDKHAAHIYCRTDTGKGRRQKGSCRSTEERIKKNAQNDSRLQFQVRLKIV